MEPRKYHMSVTLTHKSGLVDDPQYVATMPDALKILELLEGLAGWEISKVEIR